jgi:hypothetical protein
VKPLLVYCVLLPALAITSFAATPQFSPRQTITTGFQHFYGMAVADFNGDGKADIAVTDNAVKKLFIYLNDGKGSFGTPISMDLTMAALGPGRIVAGDFNEDGKQDLIIGTVAGLQSNLVLIGNGDGTFTQMADIPNSFGFLSALAVDVNGDHHLDLIVGTNPGADVFLGDGHGGFRHGSVSGNNNIFSAVSGVAAGDFNKDGKVDFAAASGSAGLTIYLGGGDGTFIASSTISGSVLGSSTTSSVAVADFDGDGNQDLLIGVTAAPIVIPGSGNGSFDASKQYYLVTGGTLINKAPYSDLVAVADMDGDQKPDAVISDDSTETVNVALNATVNSLRNLSTYTGSGVDFFNSIDQGVSVLSLADLNGDGLPDIVVGSNVTQNISVFLSIKPKAAATATLTPSANPQLVGSSVTFTAKISGTGGNSPTGTVTLLDGTTTLGQQTLDANAQATFSLSSLTAGQHTLTAVYSGDNSFLPATSPALTQSIADFQIALPTTSQTVTAGGTANYSLTITPAGGLTGPISITCSQLPSLASCDPVSVSVTGQPATATLVVHTTAAVTSRSRSSIRTAGLGLFAIAFTALLPLRRRRPIQLLVAALVMILAGSVVGCSGGSTNSTTTPGTPSGTTQFTITSSVTLGGQTLTRTNTATLVVQ